MIHPQLAVGPPKALRLGNGNPEFVVATMNDVVVVKSRLPPLVGKLTSAVVALAVDVEVVDKRMRVWAKLMAVVKDLKAASDTLGNAFEVPCIWHIVSRTDDSPMCSYATT